MVRAALGEREPAGPMTDEEKAQARRQATGVWIKSVASAVAATVVLWLLVRVVIH